MTEPLGPPAYEHNGAAVDREAFYGIACDPRRSVAVEACAGAGKTWMLVSRMVRALLAGTQPQEILAITFTKKAAGEMRQRLQEWLAQWSTAAPLELAQALVARGIARPTETDVEALRGLYTQLLQQGRPVQIRTFHSWFAALLRSAPMAVLEQLGLPARYELLEDDSEAVARVWRRFHLAVARDEQARADYQASVASYGRSQTLKALHAALGKRVEFSLADEHGVVASSVRPFAEVDPRLAGLDAPEGALADEAAAARWLGRARALGAEANKTPQQAAQAVVEAFGQSDLARRLDLLRKAFLVSGEDRLNSRLDKFDAAREAEVELQALCAARAQHQAWLHHGRMARLARLLIAEFAALKREQGWVDMNDVERAALLMLGDPVLSGWVQERLDARVRQLLIDEFQDTNPLQWQALSAWLGSYAGAGAGALAVFIVGDPKQSIYRFRRAEPQVFTAAQKFVVEGLGGDRLSCDHTHRNAPRLLAAVNQVMGAAQAAHEFTGFRPHTTESRAAGGLAALPQVAREPRVAAEAAQGWRDSLVTPREEPEERLAAVECRQAAAWIAARIAAGADPADIMVLARRRERLAAMEEELRALHIPTQQPEKSDLAQAPEVRDITALLDVVVSPGHDLSLAQVLLSPVFAVGEPAVVALATLVRAQRGQGQAASWYELLQQRGAELPAGLQSVAAALARWRQLVQQLPPHDALQAIYEEGDVLARYACAAPPPLRPAVLANLRALLGAALQIRGGRYLTPYALVRALKAGGIAGPALAVPGVVRLLTVHGAKGLEAPVVLLLDTDGAPPRAETMGVLCEWPGEAPAPWRFAFIASETRPPACNADALVFEQSQRRREELNALYVAMTRARCELVISSVQPANGQADSWWQRLLPLCTQLESPPRAAAQVQAAGEFSMPVLPHAPPMDMGPDSEDELPASAESRLGEAMHRLLEWGPADGAFSDGQRRRVAREFALPAEAAQRAADMAARILAGEASWAWDGGQIDWQGNEVALHHEGELLRIDRLVRRRGSGEWWVLDYKSNARPEEDAQLMAQLQRYARAVRAANPGAAVRTAFLTPQGRLIVADA